MSRRAIVDVQDPIIVASAYAPQLDLALLRTRSDYYASQTPTASDCLLVIEVSDSSAEFDRQIKMPRYARGGVVELWLVELERDVVVVYRDPAGDAYQHVQVFRRGVSSIATVARLARHNTVSQPSWFAANHPGCTRARAPCHQIQASRSGSTSANPGRAMLLGRTARRRIGSRSWRANEASSSTAVVSDSVTGFPRSLS